MEKKHKSENIYFPKPRVIYSESWKLYTEKLQTLVGINLFPVGLGLLSFFLPQTPFGKSESFEATTISFLVNIASFVLGVVSQAALLYAVTGKNTIQEAYQKGLQIALSLFWVYFLMLLRIIVGLLLLILPGIYLSVQYIFADVILIIEGKRGMKALSGSAGYVKGIWWKIFVTYAIVSVLYFVCYFGLSMAPSIFPGASTLLSQLYALIFSPILTTTIYVMYLHVKSAKK